MRRFFNLSQSKSTTSGGQPEQVGQYFKHLREVPWFPEFEWVATSNEASDIINKPHEDYPERVSLTKLAIETSHTSIQISNLLSIHMRIFEGTDHAGLLRNVNVQVGNHVPPNWQSVMNHMIELQMIHRPNFDKVQKVSSKLIEFLKDWYSDFETIHPFEDGNGRVGGVIVAINSYKWYPLME